MNKKTIPFSEISKQFQESLSEEEKLIYKERRVLHSKKLESYKQTANLPEFKDIEEYAYWLNNTKEGREHARNLERIEKELNKECPWGGARKGAGRKAKAVTRVAFTRRLLPETLAVLKDYAKEHDINETEALEIAILKLKQA